MKKVYYDPNQYAVAAPDSQAMAHAERLLSPLVNELTISNYLVLMCIRVLVKRQLIDHRELEIHYKSHILEVDKNGGNLDHPEGLGDEMGTILQELYGM